MRVRFSEMGLRGRSVLLTVAGLIPVVVFAAMLMFLLWTEQQRAMRANLEDTARALALAVDRELSGHAARLEVMARSENLERDDLSAFYREGSRVLQSDSRLVNVSLSRPDGQQLLNLRAPLGSALPRSVERSHQERVLATGRPSISDLFVGPVSRERVIDVTVPVVRQGKISYLLSGSFDLDTLAQLVSQQELPGEGTASVYDSRHRLVASSRNSDRYVGREAAPSLREAMRGDAGTSRLPLDDGGQGHSYSAWGRLPSWDGWYASYDVPARLTEGPLFRSLTVLSIAGLLVVGLSGAIAWWLGGRLVTSLSVATSAAGLLAGAKKLPRVRSRVKELADLGAALEETRRQLDEAARKRAEVERERNQLLAQLEKDWLRAESANRAKDEFLAMLGHELRNPLAAIQNATALLAGPDDPRRAERARGVIARQTAHLAKLTDDLLDVARVVTGRITLDRKVIDFEDLVRRTAEVVVSARDGAAALTLELEPAWVEGDPTRLEQVAGNLITNALKYTPPTGHVRVRVSQKDGVVALDVADDGEGLAPDLVPRVFDLFVQGERTLDRAQGGLGVGLTLVQRLVSLHGGEVSARSDGPGCGSTFSVRLPSVEQPPAQGSPKAREERMSHRVLVIEDNVDAREVLSDLLRMHGLEVDEAGDGLAALERAAAGVPDVALVDIGLPGMDGYEVARRFRGDPKLRNVALFALSGYGRDRDREAALAAGFDEHLVKPVDTGRLLELIRARAPGAGAGAAGDRA